MLNRRTLIAVAALATAVFTAPVHAQDKSIVVSSTTSTQDSGLFGYILPLFKQKTGIEVKVVAQGTGQALDTGRRGDADVVFVHAKSAEEKFLAEGEGVKRYPVMYNDFVLIGPKSDPAGIKGMKDVGKALRTSRQTGAPSSRAATDPAPTSRNSALWTRMPASTSRRKRALVQVDRPGHGRSAQYCRRQQCLCAVGSRHLDFTSRTRVISSSRWKATSAFSTSMASCWSIRPSTRT